MCGIAGIIDLSGRPVDREVLARMTGALAHRGPDGDGFHLDQAGAQGPSCGLGHRRLSIIDLRPSVRHPLANEDGTVWAMVNGEFYGFKEQRAELEGKGHKFATDCDSEILVHLYEEEGPAAVKKLKGMFALALWDGRARRLLLARDRLGQKPLYWTQIRDRILFASEIKALFADPAMERRLNLSGLANYLRFLYLPGQESMVDGVRRLPPGHLALIDQEGVRGERYWRLPPQAGEPGQAVRGEKRAAEELERLLSQAVELRLVSDAPLGAFLSGGLDSSLICALMTKLLAGSGQKARTYTVRFSEASFDESAKAAKVAKALGTEHTEVEVEPDVLSLIEDLIYFLDEPMADSSAIPTYWLCQATRRHVTVALSGDGGDELLAGYRRYVGRRMAERYNGLPGPLKRMIRAGAGLLPSSAAYEGRSLSKKLKKFLDQARQVELFPNTSRIDFLGPRELAGLLTPEAAAKAGPDPVEARFKACPFSDPVARMGWVDLLTYLPDDILVKVDRMSMAHALEVRSPFLDHQVVEFLAQVPVGLKLKGLTAKHLLKKVAGRYLDKEIIHQPKQGFEVPLAAWFRNELKGVIRQALSRPELERTGLLKPGSSAELVNRHLSGREDRAQVLWGLLVLELWMKRFKVGAG